MAITARTLPLLGSTSGDMALTPDMFPGVPATVDHAHVLAQMVRRAASPGFERWWQRARTAGFCANPVQLTGTDPHGSAARVWTRCNNRRAVVCPSCSDLYARDTWQLVHAGITGGHHTMPATVAEHPQVFLTLTAPSYGPVHTAPRGPGYGGARCHERPPGGERRCPHGNPLSCNQTHGADDPLVGQPLCVRCYDYTGHVLFSWHLPELWRRFTITVRRALRRRLQAAGVTPDAVRVSFVKVTEMQRRAIAHLHAVIRLDAPTEPGQSPLPPTAGVGAPELAGLVLDAARGVTLTVPSPDVATDTGERTLRFGTQIDAQPLTTAGPADHDDDLARGVRSGRTIAGYLAKYVTKSVAEFGVAVRRISPLAIPTLDVTPHVRAILTTITGLAEHGFPDMIRWLHTLGYRGHITTKSRQFSTTMTALRAHRAAWTRQQSLEHSGGEHYSKPGARQSCGEVEWTFEPSGWHRTLGDLALLTSAAHRAIEGRHTARDALRAHDPPEPPGGPP
jgi:uncharacterized Zn-finger protein